MEKKTEIEEEESEEELLLEVKKERKKDNKQWCQENTSTFCFEEELAKKVHTNVGQEKEDICKHSFYFYCMENIPPLLSLPLGIKHILERKN